MKSQLSADKKATEQFIILGPLDDYVDSCLISKHEYVVVINYVQHYYSIPSQGHQSGKTYNGL